MNEETKNLLNIAKKIAGKQLITYEELQGFVTDVANVLAQYRSATSQINKETKDTLNTLVKTIDEAHKAILDKNISKVEIYMEDAKNKLASKAEPIVNEYTDTQKKELKKVFEKQKKELESIVARTPVDGITPIKGVDYFDGVKGDKGDKGDAGKDGNIDTPEEVVTKVNKSKTKIKHTQIDGLTESFDKLASSVSNNVQSPILDVYNAGSLVKTRVSKINFSAGATVVGDTVQISASGGSQAAIQAQDEGVNLGTSGTVDTINFVGSGVTATRSTNTVTVTIPGGGGSTPTGTGFTHITAGVQDAAAKLVDTADINNSQVTLAKIANIATDTILGRATAASGVVEELTALPFAYTGDVTRPADSNVTTISNSAVTLAKQADVATSTVFYRKTAGTGAPEVQTLATLKTDLGLTGTNSGDQTITLTSDVTGSGTGSFATTIANNAVTNAKAAQVATGTIKGRVTAGTGNVEDLTGTQATTLLDTFTSALKGLVPASGGGTTTFLRADGTFATPSGSGDMVLASTQTNSGLKTFLDGTIGLRNVANTFTGLFTNTITAARTWTWPDKNGTVAMTSDITGTNSGTNTGDQTISITGDVTASGSTGVLNATVTKINGTALSGLATGILKNTTTTGVPSIAVAGTDYQVPITAGDLTTSGATSTLATVNANVGSFGSASSVATFTVNAKGLITAAVSTAISITSTAVSDFATAVAALITNKADKATTISTTAPLSGSGDLSANRTITTSMNTNKLIGRGTAGTGVMEEITLGTGLSLTGTTLNASGSGGTITTQDEGSTLSTTVTTLNFTGAGVTASGAGATTTINIPGGGGGSGDAITESISQTSHGFAVGDLIYYNGTSFVKSQADTVVKAETYGMVTTVTDANNFVMTTRGNVTTLSGLTAGTVYFLDPTTAGAMTSTKPTTVGQIIKPVFVAKSTTAGQFLNYLGTVIDTYSGSIPMSTTEVNIGTKPRSSGTFNITTSGLTSGRPVLVVQASGPYTGKGTLADEAEMDSITVRAKATSTTNIQCYWSSMTYITGNIKFDYVAG